VQTERGPYAGATITVPGRDTAELLAEALPRLTAALSFPKTMRWGPERFRFARPIRWLVALLGEHVIPFAIEGVRTGRQTYGHRILARGPFEIASAADYEAALAQGRVVLRASDRAERIEALLAETASAIGGIVVPDAALVEEVSYLVETPSALAGRFDEEFLELPDPVVAIAMRDHQRYFAVRDRDGALLPHFLCVTNSAPEAVEQVVDGNQRVLRARLDDARFYWNEDLKTTLAEKVPALDKVVWLRGFGSLKEKSERIAAIAASLVAGADAEIRATVARAALLAKTDLVTEMIKDGKEFTSLQGVMGREYARRNGESEAVGRALEEQYLPRFSGDALPASIPGASLAVADRIDTLVGVWAAGMKPTGSKDPFALRRGVLGVIRILVAQGWDVSIESLIARAADGFGDRLEDRDTVEAEAAAFARDRLGGHLVEEGFEADVVAAVVESAGAHPLDARARCEALSALRSSRGDDFEALAAGFKRARNILKKGAVDGDPSEEALVEPAEKELYAAYVATAREAGDAAAERRYADALGRLAGLRGPIDAFFDHVLVMAEDEAVRTNRLRLLGRIVEALMAIADLSRIAAPEEKA